MPNARPIQVWIDYVFDHPIAESAWYWAEDAAAVVRGDEEWPEPPGDIADHIILTFENSNHYLSRFTDAQLNQGFWYLFGNCDPRFMEVLYDERVLLDTRLRILQSYVTLFEQLMAIRCSPSLGHLSETGEKTLNSACYMWFDHLPDRFQPGRVLDAGLADKLACVLRSVLAIPHDACRESALHGIGHWISLLQSAVRGIDHCAFLLPQLRETVDCFIDANSELRPELIEYAKRARLGRVL